MRYTIPRALASRPMLGLACRCLALLSFRPSTHRCTVFPMQEPPGSGNVEVFCDVGENGPRGFDLQFAIANVLVKDPALYHLPRCGFRDQCTTNVGTSTWPETRSKMAPHQRDRWIIAGQPIGPASLPPESAQEIDLVPKREESPRRRKQKTPIRPGRMAPMRSKSNRSLSPALPGPGCGLPGPQISPGLGHGHGTGSSASVLRLDQDDAGQDEARGPVRLILTASHGLQ
ncbi:hypothetical protein BKA56DRAFT_684569 [Ilyonectria sp. MPI-CAGE-AT-0026]|nr:hypothetical protein BKA56DRAFT_684569 [Ilyonectria sp. MPI-CAGE-AT-0026]